MAVTDLTSSQIAVRLTAEQQAAIRFLDKYTYVRYGEAKNLRCLARGYGRGLYEVVGQGIQITTLGASVAREVRSLKAASDD